MATREDLHRLVSSLPEHAFDSAYAALIGLLDGPPADQFAALEPFRQAQRQVYQRLEERMRERLEQLARRTPGR